MTDFYGDESPIEETKVCTCCGYEKPLSEFRALIDKRCVIPLRRHSWCRACINLTEQARRDRLRKQGGLALRREKERQRKARYRAEHHEQIKTYARNRYWEQKRKKFEFIIRGTE